MPPLLPLYYAYTAPLLTHFSSQLHPSVPLLSPSDPEEYRTLLEGCIVACREAPRVGAPVVPPEVGCELGDVIDRVHRRMFDLGRGRSDNVLALGYRLADQRAEPTKAQNRRPGLSNFFVNTNVTLIQSPAWQLLFSRIGEHLLLPLLTSTSLFLSLPNGNYMQIAGTPITELAPLPGPSKASKQPSPPDPPLTAPPAKRLRATASESAVRPAPAPAVGTLRATESAGVLVASTVGAAAKDKGKAKANGPPPVLKKPSEIAFVRARQFYARPVRTRTKKIIVGLPPLHVLSNHPTPAHLLRYLFPRQHGLHNVFTSPREWRTTVHPFRDYTDREAEIQALEKLHGKRSFERALSCGKIKDRTLKAEHATPRALRTPKRLTGDVMLLAKRMIRRHERFDYRAALGRCCASKLKSKTDPSQILEMMSELSPSSFPHPTPRHTTQPASGDITASDIDTSVVSAHGPSQAARASREKPAFLELECGAGEVSRFARMVVREVIPKDFWGSDWNQDLLLSQIDTFVRLRRFETLSLHGVLQGVRIPDMRWACRCSSSKGGRVPADESKKRDELVREWVYWLFDGFLIALLKTTFYITDSSAGKRRVHYFRQDDWDAACKPLLERLSSTIFEEMTADEVQRAMQHRRLGYSFVRLLPKETGVRPIVNLRRRIVKKGEAKNQLGPSINHVLQAAFQILTFEKTRRPDLLGASVLGSSEIYAKLKAFRGRVFGDNKSIPDKLYFVKVDVQACFDTIPQDKLFEILEEVLSEDGYMLQKYQQLATSAGQPKRTFFKKAVPDSEHPLFIETAANLAGRLRNAIFVDQVAYPHEPREEIIALLREHITENIVKIGDAFYRQCIGIPQGSVLSTLLCSFFYGDLERTSLQFVRATPTGVLLRLIDDFLFISTVRSDARRFLQVMHEGHPEYGCFISKEKTLANFDVSLEPGVTIPCLEGTDFPWCGMLIDTQSLHVRLDQCKFFQGDPRDGLSMGLHKSPGKMFENRLIQSIKLKSHAIYLDTALNSPQVVCANVYQNFVVAAFKMHVYIKEWGANVREREGFFASTIERTIHLAFIFIQTKINSQIGRTCGARCDISQAAIAWLGYHAFHRVLLRKPAVYGGLARRFAKELGRPRYRRVARGLGATVKQVWKEVDALRS